MNMKLRRGDIYHYRHVAALVGLVSCIVCFVFLSLILFCVLKSSYNQVDYDPCFAWIYIACASMGVGVLGMVTAKVLEIKAES